MTAFPKLPDKPECLGFRKTIVLDKDEHKALNCLVEEAIQFCIDNPVLHGSAIESRFRSLKEKLNAPTPPPN